MKFFLLLLLIVLFAFVGVQGYRIILQRIEYREKIQGLSQKAEVLKAENVGLSQDIEFYAREENAVKELQSRANYHKPDEQMMILVPGEED